jgi:hypothetical protein
MSAYPLCQPWRHGSLNDRLGSISDAHVARNTLSPAPHFKPMHTVASRSSSDARPRSPTITVPWSGFLSRRAGAAPTAIVLDVSNHCLVIRTKSTLALFTSSPQHPFHTPQVTEGDSQWPRTIPTRPPVHGESECRMASSATGKITNRGRRRYGADRPLLKQWSSRASLGTGSSLSTLRCSQWLGPVS